MERRKFLTSTLALFTTASGCLGNDGVENNNTSSEGSSTTHDSGTETTDRPIDDIIIVLNYLRNDSNNVKISLNSDVIIDRNIDSRKTIRVNSGISERGNYTLEIDVEGSETITKNVSVADYDLENGSNIIIEIKDNEINVKKEE